MNTTSKLTIKKALFIIAAIAFLISFFGVILFFLFVQGRGITFMDHMYDWYRFAAKGMVMALFAIVLTGLALLGLQKIYEKLFPNTEIEED